MLMLHHTRQLGFISKMPDKTLTSHLTFKDLEPGWQGAAVGSRAQVN
jgi:hypothetical protein